MHAVIAGISDASYDKLIALAEKRMDHSWLATHLLEQAIANAPTPGTCKWCGEVFFTWNPSRGHPFQYCSDPCRTRGFRERKVRWWRQKGKAWRQTRAAAALGR